MITAAWDQTYLREMAKAAREGQHIKQEVRRRFNAAVIADAKRTLTLKRQRTAQAARVCGP